MCHPKGHLLPIRRNNLHLPSCFICWLLWVRLYHTKGHLWPYGSHSLQIFHVWGIYVGGCSIPRIIYVPIGEYLTICVHVWGFYECECVIRSVSYETKVGIPYNLFPWLSHWCMWLYHPKRQLRPQDDLSGESNVICFYVWGINGRYCFVQRFSYVPKRGISWIYYYYIELIDDHLVEGRKAMMMCVDMSAQGSDTSLRGESLAFLFLRLIHCRSF